MKHYSWNAIQSFGTQIISFVGNVFIARLLTPEDYGLIAMLAIFMSIAINFTESGLADFLISNPKSSHKEFSVVFLHNVVFSILFYLFLYVAAPFIANFYNEQELVKITRVLGINIILRAFSLAEITRMRKDLEFRNSAIIQLCSVLIGVIVGYVLALNGLGYWALVAQIITIGICTIIFIIIINSWRPSFYFNWKIYITMRKFGNNMLVSYFTNQIGANIYSVVIGKYHSAMSLGFYNHAEKINKINFQSINSVILNTSYSLLSKERNRVKRLKMYHNILNNFLFVHIALSLLLVGIAEPLIALIFGNQWLPSVPLLRLLVLSFIMQPFITINSNIVKIENKPQTYRNFTMLRNGFLLLALLLTFNYSLEIILVGQAFARIISTGIGVYMCGKYVGFNAKSQFSLLLNHSIIPFSAFLLSCLLIYKVIEVSYIQKLLFFTIVYSILFVLGNLFSKNTVFVNVFKKIKLYKSELNI